MAHKKFYLSVRERSLLLDILSGILFTASSHISETDFNDLYDLRYKLLINLDSE